MLSTLQPPVEKQNKYNSRYQEIIFYAVVELSLFPSVRYKYQERNC